MKKTFTFLLMALLVSMAGISFTACGSDDDDAGGRNHDPQAPDNVEAVDLGLPSGTKWANMNVGASNPEDYGDYFQWGETFPCTNLKEYCDYNYRYNPGGLEYSIKHFRICGTSQDPIYSDGAIKQDANGGWQGGIAGNVKYDAATANWGRRWKTPTIEQIEELLDPYYCTWTWTELNGIKGYNITSNKNGNSIFLPAAGYRKGWELLLKNIFGFYWSSTIHVNLADSALGLEFYENGISQHNAYERCYGRSVRPVLQ